MFFVFYLWSPHLKSICFSCRVTMATRGGLPVLSMCSSTLDDMICVVISASAATPAPQQLQNIHDFNKIKHLCIIMIFQKKGGICFIVLYCILEMFLSKGSNLNNFSPSIYCTCHIVYLKNSLTQAQEELGPESTCHTTCTTAASPSP